MTLFGTEMEAGCPALDGDIAIIGMACLFPAAPNLDAYWQNIVSGVDAITDVPSGRWNPEIFFDPDSDARDRLYCKRGGYLGDLAQFNPLDYGVMPVAVDGGEPAHFLSLRMAHDSLVDAGYADRPFNRERAEVIFGYANYISPGNFNRALHTVGIEQTLQIVKNLHPEYTIEELEALKRELIASLPPFGPDTVGSMLPNLVTGYVANRLNLMGANFTVDAACASALIAADLAVRDLHAKRCDLALVGAIHLATHVPFLSGFCHLNALSRQSHIRPFDANADGTLAGEGGGVVVLKRRADAERDGDRVYAVIKGIGTSSDGRAQGPFAPRVEGEELAMRRAYEAAGFSPETVELIEAHGTGTPVGDLAEMEALSRVFGPRKGLLPTCAVGTIKSMIGHTMPAAGIAGLIKVALALYHKVLTPTLHCEKPNPKFELERTPFYINTDTRPWVHGALEAPRRAAVNAFGFGGVNAHVIVEEHASGGEDAGSSRLLHWETEVCVLQGASRPDLLHEIQRLERYLGTAHAAHLKDLAYTLNTELREGTLRLAIVASSTEDLRQKLMQARERLGEPACQQIKDARGLYFFERPLRRNGKLAFLFPGEAAQYPNMLKDLCLHFHEVRALFDRADQLFIKRGTSFLPSQFIFPTPNPSDAERLGMEERLWEIAGALQAILTANWALYTLLRRLGIRPDVLLGHSGGEYSALGASGILTADDHMLERLAAMSAIYERLTAEGRLPEAGLAAVGADRTVLMSLPEQLRRELSVAMDNCPHQIVIAGSEEVVEGAVEELKAKGVVCQRLPFNRAYHTPQFAAVTQPVRELVESLPIAAAEVEIYSSATMRPYAREPQEIRKQVVDLWSRPVEFRGSIEALYEAGVRIFVEVGPKGNLAAFVEDTLRGLPHLAIGCDVPHRCGVTQLNHLIGTLAAQGVDMRLDYLYKRRSPWRLPLDGPGTTGDRARKPSPSLRLALDLPTMRLSPERARSLEPRPSSRAEGTTAAVTSKERTLPADSEQVPASLSASAARLEHMAGGGSVLAQEGTLHHPFSDVASRVMQEHLQIMGRFLAVEGEVMEAFLDGAGAVSMVETTDVPPARSSLSLPFIGEVVSMTPGRTVVIRRRIDCDEDVFLRDHSFGGQVISDVDETLGTLPVVPFTMCMEIVAEAAALLMPDKVLIGMREIQVRQWLEVDTPITLEISAQKRPSGEEVDVWIRNLGDGTVADGRPDPLIVEGSVIFGDTYAEPPAIAPLSLTSERPCRHTAKQLYEDRLMFHGSRFQGVASLDRSGKNGMVGQLQVLPPTDLFRSTRGPDLLTDPVLLDAASQLLGYWAAERLDAGYVVFPFRLSALEIYGVTPPVGARVKCEWEIQQVTTRQLRASMSLFGQDGRLLLRMVDWEDWRFYWPREWYNFFRFPKTHPVSNPWATPIARLPHHETLACQRLDPTAEATRDIAVRTLAHIILSRPERERWRTLKGPEVRRIEWLFGRAAAKDAVRQMLKNRHQMDICPADIEIGQDEDGRPVARVLGWGESALVPSLSIAHTDGLAVALAGYCREGERLGIDIERIRERQEAFQEIAFNEDELALLETLEDPGRDEWVTRLWCAKEAAAKALGKGLVEGPRSLEVRKLNAQTGTMEVALGDRLAQEFPELAQVLLVVYTAREENWVVACTICERS